MLDKKVDHIDNTPDVNSDHDAPIENMECMVCSSEFSDGCMMVETGEIEE